MGRGGLLPAGFMKTRQQCPGEARSPGMSVVLRYKRERALSFKSTVTSYVQGIIYSDNYSWESPREVLCWKWEHWLLFCSAWLVFFFLIFKIGMWLLHNIAFVSAVQWVSQPSVYIYPLPLELLSHHPHPRPSRSSRHLAELTVPCFPLASYFTLVVYIYMAMLLSQFVTLTTFPHCSHKSILYKSSG